MDLTIIIPEFNEEGVIEKTLESLRKHVKIPHKILVVDGISTDNTFNVVKNYSKKYKNISIIKTKPKDKKFASSIKVGFDKVKSGAVVVVMGDLCDNPKTINQMYLKLLEGWDVVCGSRYMKGGRKIGGPVLQHFLSMFVCKSLQIFTGVPTSDVSNAFKMYKKSALKGIRANPVSGVEGSMEFLFQVHFFNNVKITEVPTIWKGRKVGKSKFKILQRTPRYFRIYMWAIENSFRKWLGIKLKNFYV